MTRFGIALDGRWEIFEGISGIRDLILTATGDLSLEYTLGQKLGLGLPFENCMPSGGALTEGVNNAVSTNAI